MKSGTIYIRKYDWRLTIMLDATCKDAEHIIRSLAGAGAGTGEITNAVKAIVCGADNQGLTYSNGGRSVSVIGKARTQAERYNTIAHELYHVVCHICGERDVQMCSEDAAWLMGDLSAEVWRLDLEN